MELFFFWLLVFFHRCIVSHRCLLELLLLQKSELLAVSWTRSYQEVDTRYVGLGFPCEGEKGSSQVNSQMSPPMTWRQHNDISLWGGWQEGKGKRRGGVFARCARQEAPATTCTWRGTLIWTVGTQAELKVATSARGSAISLQGRRHATNFPNKSIIWSLVCLGSAPLFLLILI